MSLLFQSKLSALEVLCYFCSGQNSVRNDPLVIPSQLGYDIQWNTSRFLLPNEMLKCNVKTFQVKGAQSRLKNLAKLFKFVVCNPCKSSPSLTILVPLLFIIISLVFSIFVKYHFQVSFNLKAIYVHGQNNSKYHDRAPLMKCSITCSWVGIFRALSTALLTTYKDISFLEL